VARRSATGDGTESSSRDVLRRQHSQGDKTEVLVQQEVAKQFAEWSIGSARQLLWHCTQLRRARAVMGGGLRQVVAVTAVVNERCHTRHRVEGKHGGVGTSASAGKRRSRACEQMSLPWRARTHSKKAHIPLSKEPYPKMRDRPARTWPP